MVKYDPTVIDGFATVLYEQADRLLITYAIIGGLVGFVAGKIMGGMLVALLMLVVFAGMGWFIAQGRAAALRLQAQTALCQRQIEANTRPDGR